MGPQNVVVLNNWKHVKEFVLMPRAPIRVTDRIFWLFDNRGAKYSSRPETFVIKELVCPNETHILLLPYG